MADLRRWSLRRELEIGRVAFELAASYSLLHFIQTRILRGGGCDGFVGILMEVGSLIFGLFIIRFEMQLLPLSLGRAFGKLRSNSNLG